jgi:hypothetical protein
MQASLIWIVTAIRWEHGTSIYIYYLKFSMQPAARRPGPSTPILARPKKARGPVRPDRAGPVRPAGGAWAAPQARP